MENRCWKRVVTLEYVSARVWCRTIQREIVRTDLCWCCVVCSESCTQCQQFLQSGYMYHFVSVNCLQCIWPTKTVPEMTYNVFSGTLNPTHFTSPSVLWRCWLGVRNSIQPVKIERWDPGMVICLEPGAYGPADATATPSSVDSLKSRLVQPFCCQLTQIVLERRPLNRCRVYSVDVYYDLHGTCRHLFLD